MSEPDITIRASDMDMGACIDEVIRRGFVITFIGPTHRDTVADGYSAQAKSTGRAVMGYGLVLDTHASSPEGALRALVEEAREEWIP